MGNGAAITIPYSGKISKEKSFAKLVKKKYNFCAENFADCSLDPSKDVTPQNYMEKAFYKTLKVFSLKIFPLFTIMPQFAC